MKDDIKNEDNLKNEDDFKSCKLHSSNANLNYSGSVWDDRVCPIVIIRLSQPASRAGALAWLSLVIIYMP